MLQSFSVYNIQPSANLSNTTLLSCVSNAERFKTVNRGDVHREAKLQYIQENLECALEKYGKKIEKNVHENQWSFVKRTQKIFLFFQRADKDSASQEEQTTYTRKFDRF